MSLTGGLMAGKGHLLYKTLYVYQVCRKIWLCSHYKSFQYTQDISETLQKVQNYWTRLGWMTGTVGHRM